MGILGHHNIMLFVSVFWCLYFTMVYWEQWRPVTLYSEYIHWQILGSLSLLDQFTSLGEVTYLMLNCGGKHFDFCELGIISSNFKNITQYVPPGKIVCQAPRLFTTLSVHIKVDSTFERSRRRKRLQLLHGQKQNIYCRSTNVCALLMFANFAIWSKTRTLIAREHFLQLL